ncbi:hypothetical protein CROQUDRAFT_658405 [Cronartium quercuum f. sp. fusiforme G11]|uniref:Protein PBN1 n=1 Tax=Cronartium quercuum f. sp. fusiforme G11 TaxID=708437 RepID=A0A9P6TAV3_9BASI|nr:hypothetical protein CROQUDRAFT_658405 [Cronartium quercuum f. sp. fusiforme G11]
MTKAGTKFELISSLLPSPGLHPRFNLTVSISTDEDFNELAPSPCLVSVLFEHIPPSLFIDRFQLQTLSIDGHLEQMKGFNPTITDTFTMAHPFTWGSRDIEAPVSFAYPSGLLIPLPRFTYAARQISNVAVELEIPFHLRYLNPHLSSSRESLKISLPGPTLVWSCNTSAPLESRPIITSSIPINILGPTGIQTDLLIVEFITSVIVWVAFVWIFYNIAFQSRNSVLKKTQ